MPHAVESKAARQLESLQRFVRYAVASDHLDEEAAGRAFAAAEQVLDAYPLGDVPAEDLTRAAGLARAGLLKEAPHLAPQIKEVLRGSPARRRR